MRTVGGQATAQRGRDQGASRRRGWDSDFVEGNPHEELGHSTDPKSLHREMRDLLPPCSQTLILSTSVRGRSRGCLRRAWWKDSQGTVRCWQNQ